MTLADSIDALLPQTQCTRCGYAGCRPYAEAIAAGEAPIDQCPPGGAAGIVALAALLGREPLPLNPANGIERLRTVAVIDEPACIGCTRCILACPVDAIVGASKRMHTVLTEECTGCELCVAPCPVDCIRMVDIEPAPRDAAAEQRWQHWLRDKAQLGRRRFQARNARLAREESARRERLAARRAAFESAPSDPIQAALARAEARRRPGNDSGSRNP
jgi:electron transport complex protein RnfB